MKKMIQIISSVILVFVVIGLAFWFGFSRGESFAEKEAIAMATKKDTFDLVLPTETEKMIIRKSDIETRLSEVSELAVYSSTYTVNEYVADFSRYIGENKDFKIPGSTNSLSFTCEGSLKVGYELSKVKCEIDEEDSKIYIILPTATVLDNHIIWDSVVCNENNNILNPIDFEEYKVIISDIEAKGLEEAETKGIYDSAKRSMETLIRTALKDIVDYEIVFL